jgi:putative sterol carrier protein
MSAEGQQADFSGMDPAEVGRMISSVPDEQLREGMASPAREQIIAEVFRRMEEHFKPASARGVNAVVHWKITGRPDGGADHWEVAVADGKCTTTDEPKQTPRVTFTLDGVDFLRLVTGGAAGPVLFMSGKLKIEGDLMFSANLPAMFTIPSGAPAPGG